MFACYSYILRILDDTSYNVTYIGNVAISIGKVKSSEAQQSYVSLQWRRVISLAYIKFVCMDERSELEKSHGESIDTWLTPNLTKLQMRWQSISTSLMRG